MMAGRGSTQAAPLHGSAVAYPPSVIALGAAFFGLLGTALLYMLLKDTLGSQGRRILWYIVFSEAVALFLLLSWQGLPFLREEAEASSESHYLCPIQGTALFVSLLALMSGVALSLALPQFQGHPMATPSSDRAQDASESGGTLPACFAGRWFDADVDAAKFFVCESRGEEERYFRPNLTLGFEAAAAECEQLGARLPFVDSWATNALVRSACGAEECWIGIEQRAASWRYLDGNATRFGNWQSEPTTSGIRAACMNSKEFCRREAFASGPELHAALSRAVYPLALVFGVPTMFSAVCMLRLARVGVQSEDSGALECVRHCDGAGVWWTAGLASLALVALIAALILWLPGSEGGALPGGPVLCVVDSAHLGFGSRHACEHGFLAALGALLGIIATLHAAQATLCCLGRRAARRVLSKAREDQGASASLDSDLVVGVPVFGGATLGAPAEGDTRGLSSSWDPELPGLVARLRSSTVAEEPRSAFEYYGRAAPTLTPIQFGSLLQDWEPSIRKNQIASFWQEADTNHDGQLTFQEFFEFLKPGELAPAGAAGDEAAAPLPPSSASPALLGAGSTSDLVSL